MAVIYQDEGLVDLLKKRNGEAAGTAPSDLRLYTAVTGTLDEDTVKADITEVGAVMGYTSKTIAPGDWGYTTDVIAHTVSAVVSKGWSFTSGSGLTILGWYCTNVGNTKVLFAEAFASSVVIGAGGGTLSLTISDVYSGC